MITNGWAAFSILVIWHGNTQQPVYCSGCRWPNTLLFVSSCGAQHSHCSQQCPTSPALLLCDSSWESLRQPSVLVSRCSLVSGTLRKNKVSAQVSGSASTVSGRSSEAL